MDNRNVQLSREDIFLGLDQLNTYLERQGLRGEICLYGGACLCLAFAARNSTRDVDAVFEPAAAVRKAAFDVAAKMGWPRNWLNDDVKRFLSSKGDSGVEVVASCEFSHLKVYTANAEYLLAMKCLAARLGSNEDDSDDENTAPDLEDATWLSRRLGLTRREEIAKIVLKFFPDHEIPERTDFFIGEVVRQLSQP